jgi:hypothetical protein
MNVVFACGLPGCNERDGKDSRDVCILKSEDRTKYHISNLFVHCMLVRREEKKRGFVETQSCNLPTAKKVELAEIPVRRVIL